MRARDPGRFNAGIACRIEEEDDEGFIRYIQAGNTEYREQVQILPESRIDTRTTDTPLQIHAESSTIIEEPAHGHLFVRFIYRRDLEPDGHQLLVGEHLKSAYRQVDIDAIALIRMLAEDQLLETPFN